MPKQRNTKTSKSTKTVKPSLTQQEEVLRLYARILVRHNTMLKKLQEQLSALSTPQQKTKDSSET